MSDNVDENTAVDRPPKRIVARRPQRKPGQLRFRKLLEAWNVAAMKITVNLAHQLSERMAALTERVVAAEKKKEPAPSLPHWKL